MRKNYYLTAVLIAIILILIARPARTQDVRILGSNLITPSPAELIAGVNQARLSNGVPALAENAQLDNSAAAKANDMCSKNYWGHGDWQSFIRAAGYTSSAIGENLAYGSNDPAATYISSWLASTEHRANMLSKSFNETGMAVVKCDNYLGLSYQTAVIVNHFGYSAPAVPKTAKDPTQAGIAVSCNI